MKQGINLTLGRKRVDSALKKFFYVTVGVFCATVVISLGLIVYRLVLRGTYDSLDQKEQKLNSQLLAMQEKKDKLIEIKSRIADVQKVLSKRSPVVSRLDSVSGVISSDTAVDAINGTDTDMQITLESDSLSLLNDLIESKIAELATDKKRGIRKIDLRSFGLNPKTLKYSLTFVITFK